MLGRIGSALQRPSEGMSWTQLAAATAFVIAVAIAWRQVTLYILREI